MHKAVLTKELIKYLKINPDGIYVDCTGGGGGHAKRVHENLSEKGRLIICDRDSDAVKRLKNLFGSYDNVDVVNSNFAEIDKVLDSLAVKYVDGLYADFGLSNYQLTDETRGFSFKKNGFLDMRMDQAGGITAYEVVNSYPKETIANILKKYGEESFAERIAEKIVKERIINKIENTHHLANVISGAIPKRFHKLNQHPATKSFQAIRIFINKELESIESLLNKIDKIVLKGGRVAFISFHSLEDRLVKDMLNYYQKDCICPPEFPECCCNKVSVFKVINKKPITPTKAEIEKNPLSRSAKLRIAEKLI